MDGWAEIQESINTYKNTAYSQIKSISWFILNMDELHVVILTQDVTLY